MEYDVIIVGAGAAGLMAAVTAAERGRRVLLLEKMDQAGRKLRITGKGRCNLTNTNTLRDTLPHIGSDSRWIRNAYGRFFNRELMDFFEQRGVPLTVERGNRVYPASGKALDIFLALVNDLESRSNVTIRKNVTVKSIKVENGMWKVESDASASKEFSTLHSPLSTRIILATGGLSYPTTGSTGAGYRMARELGHTIVEPVPALVPLKCAEKIPDELVGFQLKNVQLSIFNSQSSIFHSPVGEMTFVADGLAGPLILSASRVASRVLHSPLSPAAPLQGELSAGLRGLPNSALRTPLTAVLDLKPGLTAEQLDRKLQADLNANGTRIFNDALRLWLPAELIPLALKQLHIEYYKRLNQINGEERRRLGRWMKGVTFTLTGTHDWNEAIVTQGGVALNEVNPKTMESKLVPGLYLVGELLDLDADTGGYNLQLAFSTGHAAGMAV